MYNSELEKLKTENEQLKIKVIELGKSSNKKSSKNRIKFTENSRVG